MDGKGRWYSRREQCSQHGIRTNEWFTLFTTATIASGHYICKLRQEVCLSETCKYEALAHTADVGMRVYGATPEALFACAAL